MKLEIHNEAAKEIRRHYDWYERRSRQAATRLADLFEATVVQIARNPLQFPLLEMRRNPGHVRRARLKGFPLYVLYSIRSDCVRVLAVPHTSQRTGYWKSRLSES